MAAHALPSRDVAQVVLARVFRLAETPTAVAPLTAHAILPRPTLEAFRPDTVLLGQAAQQPEYVGHGPDINFAGVPDDKPIRSSRAVEGRAGTGTKGLRRYAGSNESTTAERCYEIRTARRERIIRAYHRSHHNQCTARWTDGALPCPSPLALSSVSAPIFSVSIDAVLP